MTASPGAASPSKRTFALPNCREAVDAACAAIGVSGDEPHVCVVITSAEAPHVILDVNDAWLRTWELERDAVVGQTFSVISGAGSSNRFVGERIAAASGGMPLSRPVNVGVVLNYAAMGTKPLCHHLVIAPAALGPEDDAPACICGVSLPIWPQARARDELDAGSLISRMQGFVTRELEVRNARHAVSGAAAQAARRSFSAPQVHKAEPLILRRTSSSSTCYTISECGGDPEEWRDWSYAASGECAHAADAHSTPERTYRRSPSCGRRFGRGLTEAMLDKVAAQPAAQQQLRFDEGGDAAAAAAPGADRAAGCGAAAAPSSRLFPAPTPLWRRVLGQSTSSST
mmetsp:Transcript_2753/g.8094  ORF Transcript_2753/g.8094 Transcript_2753/m.8094 type:complete len:343 (+) Transcript_2753:35-1063(+)